MAEPGQIEQLYAPQTRQILEGLGLFDVFHSSWFIALLGLLCLNITFASIDRFPGTWEYLRHPQRELD
jgi:cytochrome c biogenesis protein